MDVNKTHFIEMLGGLRARVGSKSITRFRTQKTAALLGYLAFYLNRTHSREELVDLFWPDSEIDAGRTSLRASLAALRQQLEPEGVPPQSVLAADRINVRLNPDAVETDVSIFEASAGAAVRISDPAERAGALAGAAELYRGPLLTGHYDDWILQERDRLQQAYSTLLRTLGSTMWEVGDLSGAIQAFQRLIAVEPLEEDAYADLMRLYAASGSLSSALKQYRDLERVLSDELDTTPSTEAKELFEQLSHGTIPEELKELSRRSRRAAVIPRDILKPGPVATVSVPVLEAGKTAVGADSVPEMLPRMLTRFFGREVEIRQILEIVRSGNTRLLTLTGPGGSGKTRLALEVTRALLPEFDGYAAFVSLSEVTDAHLIPEAISSALQLPKNSGMDPMDQLIEALRSRKALLLLDSFEQLTEDGPATLLILLSRVPQLVCMVTSRQRLEVGGEQEFAVTPLPVPVMAGSPEHLNRYASVQLFVDRAQAARSGFSMTGENAAAIAAVCERVEGIPLAIELAAAWCDILTPAQILARLSHRFDLLASRRRDLAPRHRTLRATFDWTYRLLTPDVQRFFSLLSVFRGGWTLEAAEAVCEEPNALDYVQQLRERSLLAAVESGGEMRFRLLDTVREYAESQMSEESRVHYRHRHLRFFEEQIAQAKQHYHGPDQTNWLNKTDQEHDNLRAALDWAAEYGPDLETGLRLAGQLEFYWGVRGHVKEGLRRYRELLQRAEESETKVSASILGPAYHGVGVMAFALGNFAGAIEALEKAVPLFREMNDRKGAADALTFKGLSMDQSDHALARETLLQARAEYEAIGDEGGLAHALKCLATNAQNRGEPNEALSLIERGLELYRGQGDRRGISMMLGQLAAVRLAQGDYLQAEAILKEHLDLSRELNDMAHTALALENIGKAVTGRGDFYVAGGYFEQCLALWRELGNRWGTLTALHRLGTVAMHQGRFSEARELFDESMTLAREINEKKSVAAILCDMGILAFRSGDFEAAQARLDESAVAYRALGDRWGELKTARDMGNIALAYGDYDRAENLYQESISIAREVGDRHGVAMALYNLGDAARHKGDMEKARDLWEKCRVIDRELGIKGGSVIGALGEAALHFGDIPRAGRMWIASLKEHWGIGDRLGAAEGLSGLSDVALASGDAERAAILHGAGAQIRENVGSPLSARGKQVEEKRAAALESALGGQSARSLIAEGREMPIEKAVVYALEMDATAPPKSPAKKAAAAAS